MLIFIHVEIRKKLIYRRDGNYRLLIEQDSDMHDSEYNGLDIF